LVHAAVAAGIVVVFVADLFTPLGIAVWVFYMAPVVAAYFAWRPQTPVMVALAATGLTAAGFYLSSPGLDPSIARINRSFGVATLWILAAIGYVFIRSKLSVRREEWLQAGEGQVREAMAGNPTTAALGEKVLAALGRHLGAAAGALYFEDGGFRRVATLGVAAPEALPERIAEGVGLLGRALAERRIITVNHLPAGYLQVGSALGKGAPAHVLLAPLGSHGAIFGVVELGFLQPVEESDEALVSRLSEPIALAARAARYRAQVQMLLEETQRQAEELHAQAEELRANNEELEAQGVALQESQVRLEEQQAELEQTNAQLEAQAQEMAARNDELLAAKRLLEEQTRAAREASQYKSTFLANMSHELRTPLNSTLILARLLADNRDGNLSAEQVKFARTIEAAGNDLLALINDVLDLAKVEAGHMEAKIQRVSLARVVDHLRDAFQAMAQQKGLGLELFLAAAAPETIESDAQRLEQILRNLLGNAIKFTEEGQVRLTVDRLGDEHVAFTVSDTGLGIPREQQERIFEAFQQAGSVGQGHGTGTGLGLSIARELARLLGGDIVLESEPGRGSAFTLQLPTSATASARPLQDVPAPAAIPASTVPSRRRAQASAPVEDDRGRLDPARRRVLIVEDDAPFARILLDLAHEADFQGLVAMNAEEALALAIEHAPAAILLDIGLPDASGLTVLDRLKRDPRTRHILVHVVSIHDYSETALSLGAAGYLLKPVQREQLSQAFRRLEARLAQKMRRVLIVEDDPVQREALKRLLGSPEVEVVSVQNAADALTLLRETVVDCLVLDLNLPGPSGFDLLERLSEEERYSFPPVIVYTGRALGVDEEQRLRRYSQSVIIKGARSPERLLDEVTLFLHQVVATLPEAQRLLLEQARRQDGTLQGRNVLVVEDDVRNVFALASVLEPLGAHVEIARTGREAIAVLERSRAPEATPVDLVLMDVMMPEMDGLTATREIRRRAEWRRLPIIALTAKAMPGDQEQALAAGASDYLAKPLDLEKLLSLMRVWMPR
jgi:signal transduction histidine kinase/DNA-binding response OmpR family regulator